MHGLDPLGGGDDAGKDDGGGGDFGLVVKRMNERVEIALLACKRLT